MQLIWNGIKFGATGQPLGRSRFWDRHNVFCLFFKLRLNEEACFLLHKFRPAKWSKTDACFYFWKSTLFKPAFQFGVILYIVNTIKLKLNTYCPEVLNIHIFNLTLFSLFGGWKLWGRGRPETTFCYFSTWSILPRQSNKTKLD